MDNIFRRANIRVKAYNLSLSYIEGPHINTLFSSGRDLIQREKLKEFLTDKELFEGVFKISVKYSPTDGSGNAGYTSKPNSIIIPRDLVGYMLEADFLKQTGESLQRVIKEEERSAVVVDYPECFGGYIKDLGGKRGCRKLFYCLTPNNWHRHNKGVTDSPKTTEEYRFQIAAFVKDVQAPDESVVLKGVMPNYFMNLKESEYDEFVYNGRVLDWIKAVTDDPAKVDDFVDFNSYESDSREEYKKSSLFNFREPSRSSPDLRKRQGEVVESKSNSQRAGKTEQKKVRLVKEV